MLAQIVTSAWNVLIQKNENFLKIQQVAME